MLDFIFHTYNKNRNLIVEFCDNQQGVTAIEYAMIGVAIALLLEKVMGNQTTGYLGALNFAFKTTINGIEAVFVK